MRRRPLARAKPRGRPQEPSRELPGNPFAPCAASPSYPILPVLPVLPLEARLPSGRPRPITENMRCKTATCVGKTAPSGTVLRPPVVLRRSRQANHPDRHAPSRRKTRFRTPAKLRRTASVARRVPTKGLRLLLLFLSRSRLTYTVRAGPRRCWCASVIPRIRAPLRSALTATLAPAPDAHFTSGLPVPEIGANVTRRNR
jgi:hypothetical protein